MTVEASASVAVQFAEHVEGISGDEVVEWVEFARRTHSGEVSVRFMGLVEARMLNRQFRNIDKPTNVLAFQSDHQDILGGSRDLYPAGVTRSAGTRKVNFRSSSSSRHTWDVALVWVRSPN